MNSFKRWFLEKMISLLLPLHSFAPGTCTNVFTNFHYTIHVMRIDNGGHVKLLGNFVNQFIYHHTRLRVEARVGFIAK